MCHAKNPSFFLDIGYMQFLKELRGQSGGEGLGSVSIDPQENLFYLPALAPMGNPEISKLAYAAACSTRLERLPREVCPEILESKLPFRRERGSKDLFSWCRYVNARNEFELLAFADGNQAPVELRVQLKSDAAEDEATLRNDHAALNTLDSEKSSSSLVYAKRLGLFFLMVSDDRSCRYFYARLSLAKPVLEFRKFYAEDRSRIMAAANYDEHNNMLTYLGGFCRVAPKDSEGVLLFSNIVYTGGGIAYEPSVITLFRNEEHQTGPVRNMFGRVYMDRSGTKDMPRAMQVSRFAAKFNAQGERDYPASEKQYICFGGERRYEDGSIREELLRFGSANLTLSPPYAYKQGEQYFKDSWKLGAAFPSLVELPAPMKGDRKSFLGHFLIFGGTDIVNERGAAGEEQKACLGRVYEARATDFTSKVVF